MNVSIEIPVIRAAWLMQCIDSVLQQTSSNWVLSLLWDQGDTLSREILERVERTRHPKIQSHYSSERLGIARARQYLTERSRSDLILPLDDDDVLLPNAVSRFLETAQERPWAGIIRARRRFIDATGEPVEMNDWFPFERRKYFNGATIDVTNHAQPYVIRRSCFEDTGGWSGFPDFEYMGEDCSCFMRLEEVSEIELLDEVLYAYRIHDQRTSLRYQTKDANEMWRRIADDASHRRHAPVRRINSSPSFEYQFATQGPARIADIDVVVPFLETNEREFDYQSSRPASERLSLQHPLRLDTHFVQRLRPKLRTFSRMELAFSCTGAVEGTVTVALSRDWSAFSPSVVLRQTLNAREATEFDTVSLLMQAAADEIATFARMEIAFEPHPDSKNGEILLHAVRAKAGPQALMRLFAHAPDYCRGRLEHCLRSVADAGIKKDAVHVVDKPQSSAANRNEGFRASRRPWICFLDDDVQLHGRQTLDIMLERMSELQATVAGPKLLTANGRIYSGVPFINPITREARISGYGEKDVGRFDVTALVPWVPSTVLIVHRSVMLSTGGFDENFVGSQHEDVDFCLRARSRGFRCCYVGAVSATHDNQLRNGQFNRNMHYLRKRWRGRQDLFLWPPRQGVHGA